MTSSAKLLSEFEEEMANTRKVLERVPGNSLAWRPHEKAFTLGRLANHVATLPLGAAILIHRRGSSPPEAASIAELLASFDNTVAASRDALASIDDERLAETVRVTPEISKPLLSAQRGRGLVNHLIHHRGQLILYLRILNVPVPGLYGPSADEKL